MSEDPSAMGQDLPGVGDRAILAPTLPVGLTCARSTCRACDTAGATLLPEAKRAQADRTTVEGADAWVAAVIALVRPAAILPAMRPTGPSPTWRAVIPSSLGASIAGVALPP